MNIKLVCLDLDGTAVEYVGTAPHLHGAVIRELNRLGQQGIEWCTNSGRSKDDQEQIVQRSVEEGLRHLPSAILSSEAFIFDRTPQGYYTDREPWNSRVHNLLREFHIKVQAQLTASGYPWQKEFLVETRWDTEYTVFLVSGTEDDVDAFCRCLNRSLNSDLEFCVTRNGGWVVVLPRSLGKGNVLQAYRSERGWRADEVFAIGDHLNDLSMLEGRAARWVGCPADAQAAVIEAVSRAGGTVATQPGAFGTAELLQLIVPQTP